MKINPHIKKKVKWDSYEDIKLVIGVQVFG
jgi:hypothetical protein